MTNPRDPRVGRIRTGASAFSAPRKLEHFRFTSASPAEKVVEKRFSCPVCGAYEGSRHLVRHPLWQRVVAALARGAHGRRQASKERS